MPFDPDKYLESKEVEFSPDDYLKKKGDSETDLEIGSENGGLSTTPDQDLFLNPPPKSVFEDSAMGQPAIDETSESIPYSGTIPKEQKLIKQASIYDLAITDAEKWYGTALSPRKKIDIFNQEAKIVKSKYDQIINNLGDPNNIDKLYDKEVSDLNKRYGIEFIDGKYKFPYPKINEEYEKEFNAVNNQYGVINLDGEYKFPELLAESDEEYNRKIPVYNERIKQYNQDIGKITEKYKEKITSYNSGLNNYNKEVDAINSKYQKNINNYNSSIKRVSEYDKEIKDLANKVGLILENGEAKLTQREIDIYEKIYAQKLNDRISILSSNKKNSYIKDVLGNLGSGSAQVLSTPYNLMAISEKIGNAILKPIGVEPATYWQEFSKYLNENQQELAQNSQRYDADIITMAKEGDTGKAIGAAVLQTAQALPMLGTLIMGNAAGATNKALSFMGTSTAAQEYMANNDRKDIGEFYKIIDAIGVGLSEVAFEQAGTVKILEGIKKGIAERGANVVQEELTNMLRTNMERNVAMIMRGNSDMVREGLSEGMTSFAQNLMAKATVDPERDIWQGVTDATIVGALIGKGINLSLNAANHIQTKGARATIRETSKQVPENYSLEAKEKLIPLIIERDVLAEQTKDLAKPIKYLTSPRIKAIDEEITKISAKEEGIELPKEEKPVGDKKKEPEATKPKSEVKVSSKGIVPLNEEKDIEKPIEVKPEEKEILPHEKAYNESMEKKDPEVIAKMPAYKGKKFSLATILPNGDISNVYVRSEGQSHKTYMSPEDAVAYEEGKMTIGFWNGEKFAEAPQKGKEYGQKVMDIAASKIEVPKIEEPIVEPKIEENIPNAEAIREDQAKDDQGGIISPEGNGESIQDVKQPKEADAKVTAEKDRVNLHNRLVGLSKTYNTIPQVHNKKKGEAFKEINNIVARMGYSLDQKEGKLLVFKDGKPIRKISIPRTKEELQSHKAITDYENKDFVDFVNLLGESPENVLGFYDTGIKKDKIPQAIEDIKAGVKNANANDLLDYLEKFHEAGEVTFYDPGSQVTLKIPIEDFKKSLKQSEDVSPQEEDIITDDDAAEVNRMIDDFNEGNLPEEDFDKIRDMLFNENSPYTEEDFNNLKEQYNDEQQARREEEGSDEVEEDNTDSQVKETGKDEESAAGKKGQVYYDVKNPNDKISRGEKEYIIIGDTVFKNNDLRLGINYNYSGGVLIEDKPSNRHTIKGEKYYSNGTVFDALQLRDDVNNLPKAVDPQTQVLNLALNDLKITIPEYKQKIEVNGKVKRIPNYTARGIKEYKTDVREFLDQIPQLSKSVSDDIIEKWYYEQLSIQLKNRNEGDLNSIGAFVHDKNVDDTLKYFNKPKKTQKESQQAKEARVKLDQEIIDQEALLKDAISRKNKKVAEFNSRNGMFGDTKKEKEAPTLLDVDTEFSQNTLGKFISKEEGEIRILKEKIATLKKNKEVKIKEAGGQKEGEWQESAFAQPSKKGKKKTPPSKGTGIKKPEPQKSKGDKEKAPPKGPWIKGEELSNEHLKGIEAPEIIEMFRKLTGQFPGLKNFTKAGKLGVFRHIEGGPFKIDLSKKLFTPDYIEMLSSVIGHEFGHFIDSLPDVFLKRGNILGRIAGLKEYFTKTLGEKPGKEDTVLTAEDRRKLRAEATRNLKEEYDKGIREIIEEVIEETPIFDETGLTAQDILDIWNDNMAREKNPELYEYIAKLSGYQKKQVVAAALKGLVDSELVKRFSKGKIVGTKITKKQIKKIVTPQPVTPEQIGKEYRELLRNEINKRRLFEEEVIRAELEKLTMARNPFDEKQDSEYTKYRYSSVELYAEALSELLVNPQNLAERAPYFNKAFFNYFDKKITFKEVYEEMQELLNKPREELLKDRMRRVYEGYKKGERKRNEIADRKEQNKLSAWERAQKNFISMIIPIIKPIPEGRRYTTALNDKQFLRDMLEKMAFANEKVAKMLVRMHNMIEEELKTAKLDFYEFSAILQFDRQINTRKTIANPYAFQEQASNELKAYIESNLSPEKQEAMTRIVKNFHDYAFSIMEETYNAGVFSKEQFDIIEKNKDSYATFAVVDYIDHNSIPVAFKKATGTLKETENPYISTLFKLAAMIRATERQNGVNTLIDTYNKYLPGAITETPIVRVKGIKVSERPTPGKRVINYWKDGKWSSVDVDPYIAELFEMDKVPKWDGGIFRTFNKGFKPVVTTWNVGWAFYSNIFRDHPRTALNLFSILASTEGLSKVEALKLPYTYLKAVASTFKDAKKFVNGELTPLLDEMIEQGVLRHGFFGSYDPHADEPVGPIFKQFGIIGKEKSFRDKMKERSIILKAGVKILEGIEYAGQVLEVGSKTTAFKILNDTLKDAQSAGFYTRNYAGTPNYLDKGSYTRTTNEIFTFSNVILQALRTDAEMAFKPQTRAAYWTATAISVGVPASLVALAAAGLFGGELEDLYSQLTEYEKSNYVCIIWGKTKDGKPIYTKFPIPEFSRISYAMTYKTISNMLDTDGIEASDFTDILAIGNAMTPSLSPLIKTGTGVMQYMAGQNPYDFFYGEKVLTDREQSAHWSGTSIKKMVNWSIKNIGGTSIVKLYDYDPIKNSTNEYILQNIPLVSRIIKIGGRGQAETLSKTGEQIRRKRATESLKEDKIINKYVLQAMSEGLDYPKSDKLLEALKKEIYGDKTSPDQNRDFSYMKKKFKTRLLKGIDSPFSSAINSIINSQSNDEKVAKLQQYCLIYGEEKFIELIDYMDEQEIVSKQLKSKVRVMVEGIDLDEDKRNTIIQALNESEYELGTFEDGYEEAR